MYHKYESWFTICGNYRTSMDVNTRLTKSMCPTTDSGRDFVSKKTYREIVSALLWWSTVCRPDLS